MTNQQASDLVQGIYDNILGSVTKAESGGQPLMPAATTVFSLMQPGLAINSKDFANPWTPGNSSGNKDAAINTANLVDAAPTMSALYSDNGNRISQVYKQILDGVNIPAQTISDAVKKQIADATAVLYRQISVTDPDSGAVSQQTVESVLYRDYEDNQTAYFNARAAYVGNYLTAQATANGRNTWPLLASTYQIPVQQAYSKWRSESASIIEQNLAIMATSASNALQLAFNEAKALFDGYGVILDDAGTGLSTPIYRSSLMPSDWHSVNSSSKWATVDIKSGSASSSQSSDYTSYGGSAGFSLGLFSIGGSAGHSESHQQASTESNGLEISFSYTLVQIRRPWLTFNLLGTKGWNLGNLYKKGLISNGSKSYASGVKPVMPLLPTSLVVVKDVVIKANWSAADSSLIKSATTGGGSVGFGPFSIGGSYSHSSSNATWHSAFASGAITVPGVQIIGWISQLVPYCPPADAVSNGKIAAAPIRAAVPR
jgi:hypothetical protein